MPSNGFLIIKSNCYCYLFFTCRKSNNFNKNRKWRIICFYFRQWISVLTLCVKS